MNWYAPVGSFLLAVVLACFTQPAIRVFAFRQAGGGTPCTPPGPPQAPARNVVANPFTKQTEYFNPAAPPAGFPGLKPGEAGVTVCPYGDTWTADYTATTCTENGTCTAVAYVLTLDITLTADCTIWLPLKPGPELTAHEEGHAEIFKIMYGAFEKKFKADLPKSPSASSPATAADCDTAVMQAQTALEASVGAWVTAELTTCKNAAQAASNAYDTDTGNGTKGNQAKDAKTEADKFSKQLLGT